MARRLVVGCTAVVVAGLLAGCGSASGGGAAAASSGKPVSVLYAGSLVNLLEQQVGPAFSKATGDGYQGYGAGSSAVATAIKGKVKTGDVFISASPAVDATLHGAANGGWVSWDATFAKAPLVLAYNPKSRFAHDFATMPWFQVLREPGIRLGRTDPVLDPKGTLTVAALQQAQQVYGLSGFAGSVEQAAAVFPEEELLGRLQAGQLDAGFFYTNEAVPAHLPTVTLGKVSEAATFTVTVLNRAPNPKGGAAFVDYLLTTARPALMAGGLQPVAPAVTGDSADVPSSLRAAVGG
jgi:molybdate/tungstate transport system substrate-binding protein